MTNKNIKLSLTKEEASIILEILTAHQSGYSFTHPPKRITLVRSIMDKLI